MEAYPVPFHLDRHAAPVLRLVNHSTETVRWVRIELDGPGVIASTITPRLLPGDGIDLRVRGADPARETRVVVRWLRDDDTQYLWGVPL